MKKTRMSALIAGALLALALPTVAEAKKGPKLTVMTRNVFLGADLSPAIGASSLAAGHLTMVPELREALDRLGGRNIMIVVGGVVPPQDHAAVRAAGAVEIFPPGTVIPDAAERLLDRLLEVR